MKCPILDLCKCGPNHICAFCIQITLAIAAIVFGSLLIWKPRKVIDIQMTMYRPFNWILKPISMPLAIKNTRIMGCIVVVLALISLIFIFRR